MASYVSIANRAAKAVGTSARLNAPGDDTTLGRAVAAVWDIEREAALRDAAWNFALSRAELPELNETPSFGYDAQFQLPADSLKLIAIEGAARLRYQVEGRRILADVSGPLQVRYLRNVTEPSEFDASFALAFALRIACAIGREIAGSNFDKRGTWGQYQDALADAKGADAVEQPPIEQEESEWVTSRYTGAQAGNLHGWVDGDA